MTIETRPALGLPHDFGRSIRTVAVIGSGPTGTPAARHLRDAGLTVRLFERQSQSGGIWNWRPDAAPPLSVPTPPPSVGAFTPVLRESGIYEDADRKERALFNPPNPCYWNLSNNVPTTTMAFKDYPYPEGTERNVSHTLLANYVHGYAERFGLDKLASYNTRVEKVEKVGGKWKLNLRKVVDEGEGRAREEQWSEEFDAVVVATGHYNAPHIPAFPGADEWASKWPEKVIHSQGYRKPEAYKDKTVLVVGIGTSGNDIARDLDSHVEKTYMVGRNRFHGPVAYQKQRRMQRFMIPDKAEVVSEIKRFIRPQDGQRIEEAEIELTDGRILKGISDVIFATGYQYSFPFLPDYHLDHQGERSETTKKHALVSDGFGVLNLWRDVFYIPDPTLTFIGLSVNTSTFSFFEYQSISIARVFAGKASIPDEAQRWADYGELIKRTGEGKYSHLLNRDGERRYVQETIEWLNRDATKTGAELVEGHSPEWIAESEKLQEVLALKYGVTPEVLKQISEEIEADNGRTQAITSKTYETAAEETNARIAAGVARRIGAIQA
ncbi:uncharacterized protein I303_100048 [Kwoniella dejecticola CBS 10117]|uniref:Dimethylaniline monooxygenase n=1 Tax=Kwoniella dejecticola CBS 10117 TaxID=1296121 RepID=A0A1A6ADU2_9TREE|nr:uncharacterized protein I303_00048 [Kwoniella dejecticola CBS 10117]OBR88237.1 hypothetical protein I303_00048 [Kwoniella dejecticola CBS 10117]